MTGERSGQLHHISLGRAPYRTTWDLQNRLADDLRRGDGTGRQTLLSVEHDPVITIGRRGSEKDILVPRSFLAERGIEVQVVDRGGEVTYHGPGQLVIYPIVRVHPRRFGVGGLVRGLAAAVEDLLGELGIAAAYNPESPGLWVNGEKICAVGMRVAEGVSTHGAALNVTTALEVFEMIVPCGAPGAPATSVERQLPGSVGIPELSELADRIASLFATRLGFELVKEGDSATFRSTGI